MIRMDNMGDDFYFGKEHCHTLSAYGYKGNVCIYIPVILKSGKPSVRFTNIVFHRFTPLQQCGMCGKVSTPKKIHSRHIPSIYNHRWYIVTTSKEEVKEAKWTGWSSARHVLCMGCWNKAIRLMNKENALTENIKLLKQLTTEIYHEKQRIKHISTLD